MVGPVSLDRQRAVVECVVIKWEGPTVDLNVLNKTLSDGVAFLGKLLATLEQQSSVANVHGSISGTVSIVKTLQGAAVSFQKLLAASDQMVSLSELRNIMGRLGDAYAEAATSAASRLDLPERERLVHRDFIVDETVRLFTLELQQFQLEITQRRQQGISALENPTLFEDQ